jgi:hypothetical protein
MPCGTADVQAHDDRHVRTVKTMPNFPPTGEGPTIWRQGYARSARQRKSARFLTAPVAEHVKQ